MAPGKETAQGQITQVLCVLEFPEPLFTLPLQCLSQGAAPSKGLPVS